MGYDIWGRGENSNILFLRTYKMNEKVLSQAPCELNDFIDPMPWLVGTSKKKQTYRQCGAMTFLYGHPVYIDSVGNNNFFFAS